MTRLSIVTVVKDDPEGLMETYKSAVQHVKFDYEHIIWIYPSNIDRYDLANIRQDDSAHVIIEEDQGIFDAMNKATTKTNGEFVLYLNAGDKFISDLTDQPERECLIPVFYDDFRGRYREVRKKSTIRMGIPYCHQGIVFKNGNIHYPPQKFASDYIAVLRSIRDWSKMEFISGSVYYRNDGVSSVNRLESDRATAEVIRREFGRPYATVFMLKSLAKLLVKRIYRTSTKIGIVEKDEGKWVS